jgi:uncharacterized OB-fold protein
MSDATDANDDNTGPGRYVSLDLRLRFSHPLGSLRPYFEALEQGRALGVRCEACARTWFPPRRTCCGRSVADNWTELAGAGTVLSITSGERSLPFTDGREPMSLALVAMDGADNAALGWIASDGSTGPGSRVRLAAAAENSVHPAQCARFEPIDD